MAFTSAQRKELDDRLSYRDMDLDPKGYFLIRVDHAAAEIVVEHYGNEIDDQGRAVDPESGEVIKCDGGGPRKPSGVYRGRTAKEVGMLLTEGPPTYTSSVTCGSSSGGSSTNDVRGGGGVGGDGGGGGDDVTAAERGAESSKKKGPPPNVVSMLNHAVYLGRELQKAERCLDDGTRYVMD